MLGSNNQPLGDHISIDCACKDRNRLLLQPIYESSACNDFLLSALMQLLQHFLSLPHVCVCVVSNYNLLYTEPHHPPLTLSLSHRETGISGSEWAACRVTVNTGKKGREEGRRREPFTSYTSVWLHRGRVRECVKTDKGRRELVMHESLTLEANRRRKRERNWESWRLEISIYTRKGVERTKKGVTLWN